MNKFSNVGYCVCEPVVGGHQTTDVQLSPAVISHFIVSQITIVSYLNSFVADLWGIWVGSPQSLGKHLVQRRVPAEVTAEWR